MFLFFVVLATAAYLAAGRGPTRVKPEPVRVGEAGEAMQGSREIKVAAYLGEKKGPWSCKSAKNQPVPDLDAIVPAQVVTLGGPIAMAIVNGVEIVRNIFKAIGAKQVCTVRGGFYESIAIWDRLPPRWISVTIEPFYGGAPAGQWTFQSSKPADNVRISDTIELPMVEKIVGDSPRQKYLMSGGVPPADLWPHINIAEFQPFVPPNLEEPRVDVIRKADKLTLYVWLPPRAPRSHTNAIGKYKIDYPVTWRISWALA